MFCILVFDDLADINALSITDCDLPLTRGFLLGVLLFDSLISSEARADCYYYLFFLTVNFDWRVLLSGTTFPSPRWVSNIL